MQITITQNQKNERLDKLLSELLNESRSQISTFIDNGFVSINDIVVTKSGHKTKEGDIITVTMPDTTKTDPKSVDFDVDVLYEDDDILVVNKPSGVVVHPCNSYSEATLVDWLKHKNIALSTISGEERHGIVHRIDKETSGALVIAKNNLSHTALSEELQSKEMGRYYLAVIDMPLKDDVVIEKPIDRNPKNRLKMGVVSCGRYAKTAFKKLLVSKNSKYELIAAKLYTGRTHQIRVHLESINRHIIGDSLYGFKGNFDTINRHLLHAYILYLTHPQTKEKLYIKANFEGSFKSFLEQNFDKEELDEKIKMDNIFGGFGDF